MVYLACGIFEKKRTIRRLCRACVGGVGPLHSQVRPGVWLFPDLYIIDDLRYVSRLGFVQFIRGEIRTSPGGSSCYLVCYFDSLHFVLCLRCGTLLRESLSSPFPRFHDDSPGEQWCPFKFCHELGGSSQRLLPRQQEQLIHNSMKHSRSTAWGRSPRLE